MLINNGADLNIVSDNGTTALGEGVRKNNYELVELLVKKRANIMNKNLEQRDSSPFFMAITL